MQKMAMKQSKRSGGWWLGYTLMYGFVLAAVLLVFGVYGRNFVYGQDGPTQHVPALIYLGEYIRSGLRGEGWKLVDFSLGQGLDVLTTLVYYGFTEPLAMLTAVFMPEQIETAYAALIFVRFYLAGLFVCLLAKELGAERWTLPAAGVVYAFCGFALGGGMKHLNFGVGMMYLPLLLLGVERVFSKKRWGLYVLTVALELVSNFYFAYMNTVIAVLYIIVCLAGRLAARERIGECAKDGFVLLGGYLLGAALSAAVLLPVAAAYLESSRLVGVEATVDSALFYDAAYYREILAAFFQYTMPVSYWTALGFIPLSGFALGALLVKRLRRGDAVCIMVILCFAMLCIPLAGSAMNGMGYISNRWTYALAVFVALATALGLKPLAECRSKKMLALCGAMLALAAFSVWEIRTVNSVLAAMVFAATALLLAANSLFGFRWLTRRRMRALLLAATLLSVTGYMVLSFLPRSTGLINAYKNQGRVADLSSNPMSVFEDCSEEEFSRAAGAFNTMYHTTGYYDAYAPVLDYNATAYYWSIIPTRISMHYIENYASAQPVSYALGGLGNDAASMLLASVRYLYVPEGSRDVQVRGFEPVEQTEDGGRIYENPDALPIGYTFDSWMPRERYDALGAVEKRDALLRTAVVDGEAGQLAEDSGASTLVPLEFRQDGGAEGQLADGMRIVCSVPGEGEVFLVFHGMKRNSINPMEFIVDGPAGANRVWAAASENSLAYLQQGAMLSMGVLGAGEAEFTFEIPGGERIACDKIEVYFRPAQAYDACAEALGANVLTDVQVGANRITGKIELDEAAWLQLSVPFSTGWTAVVDGAEAELAGSGGMYMGLLLEPGSHVVELNYCTPLLREGAVISAAAALLCLIFAFAGKFRRGRGG